MDFSSFLKRDVAQETQRQATSFSSFLRHGPQLPDRQAFVCHKEGMAALCEPGCC